MYHSIFKPCWDSWLIHIISNVVCLNMYISWILSLLIVNLSLSPIMIIQTRSLGWWGDSKCTMVKSLIGLPRRAEKCPYLHCNRTRRPIEINAIPFYPRSQGLSSAFVGVEFFLPSKDAKLSQIICNLKCKCWRLCWLNRRDVTHTVQLVGFWKKKLYIIITLAL